MTVLLPRDRLLLRALLASLLLHALVAYVIPAMTVVPGDNPPIETLSFVHALPIRIDTPHPLTTLPPAIARQRAPAQHLRQQPLTGHHPVPKAPKLPATRTYPRVAPILGPMARQGSSQTRVAATPAPTATAPPTTTTVASAETKNDAGGFMPLGAEDPVPVLDPAVRSRLAGLGVHTTLTIVVGSDGKTKSVSFDPAIDPAIESRIREMLASAGWDPATCGGGIACEARATVKL